MSEPKRHAISAPMGRAAIVQQLLADAHAGRTVLLYGPHGIGKTAILRSVHESVRATGRPAAFVSRTEGLADVTAALAAEYLPGDRAVSLRALRVLLQVAIEDRPGVLLVDDVRAATSALKGFLRGLEGTGLGIVIAADAENERDHEALRAKRLAYRELKVPALSPQHMRRILERSCEYLDRAVCGEDVAALLDVAAGRPGILRFLLTRLEEPQVWRDGRLRLELLRSDAAIEVGRAYVLGSRAVVGSVPRRPTSP